MEMQVQWRFFAVLGRAHRGLAAAWWLLIAARGALPAIFAVAAGAAVRALGRHDDATAPLLVLGAVFVLGQVLAPVHTQVGANLGERLSLWLHDRLLVATTRPAGLAHLESAELAADLALARDFDLGISDPPLSLSLPLIAGGLVDLATGLAQAALLVGYRWWAPILLGGAWAATHALLRAGTMWDRDSDEARTAHRVADYSYRLAVDAPAAKELRIFGLADWTVARFAAQRRRLVELRWQAIRLRPGPTTAAIALVIAANTVFFWSLARSASEIGIGGVTTYAQAAVGAAGLAFGGLNWALPLAASGVAAVLRLGPAMESAGQLPNGDAQPKQKPGIALRLDDVGFSYDGKPILGGVRLDIPAGTSLAIVGRNGAGKTTLVKLLCRLYDPTSGTIAADGIDLRSLDIEAWRSRVSAVFQDFLRCELPLRDNVAPLGGTDEAIRNALAAADATGLAEPDTVLARGYDGGIDLSGGQWQRIALARALHAVECGAGLVILDEPTAQLDVRAEAEIFDRILAATRDRTTILISHRFSTVRQADQICVLEDGRVAELGSHAELMAAGGRYREMFELQAARFASEEPHV
jgi:ATP-binding cassette subfamily B protein